MEVVVVGTVVVVVVVAGALRVKSIVPLTGSPSAETAFQAMA